MSIHPTAVVDPDARLGAGVSVGPHAVIEGDVEVGEGCAIGPHAVLMRYTTLGAGCRVHAGAVVGDVPQDLGFKGGPSYVRVGAQCILREGVTIHRGTQPDSVTQVGDRCFLMAGSHLGHNVTLGNDVVVANASLLAGYVHVGDRAFISGLVVVHQFVHVGRLAMLGGATAVSKDVPPFCMVRPNALNVLAGLNRVGMKRAGLTPAERAEIKRVFDLIYRSGLNVAQALQRLREAPPAGPAAEFLRFAEIATRGFCRLGADEEGDEAPTE